MIDALGIGFAIKERRSQLNLTQDQVAQAAGVSKRCLWSIELGQNPGVQLNKLIAVLTVLGFDLTLAVLDNKPVEETIVSPEAKHQAIPSVKPQAGDFPIDVLAILAGESKR